MSNEIRIGSIVEYQNLVCKVVGRDGKDYIIQPNSSSSRITAGSAQLSVVLNEGHLESSRLEEYRNQLMCD